MIKGFAALIVSLLFIPSVSSAAEGILFLVPDRGTYAINDEFVIEVRANTDGSISNAAEADLVFNPAALEVVQISTEGSELSLWPSPPEFSNTHGTVRFSGTASGSFESSNALLIRIQFRAKSNVPGDVHFDSGALLLNDVRATNIITGMRSGLYTVVPRQSPPAPSADVDVIATTSTITTEPQSPSPEVRGASVQIPAITGYDDRVSIGERIVLQGSAAPDSTITVYLQYEDDAPRVSEVLTVRDGSFTYVASALAERGMYRAWASVQTESGELSSETVVIAVRADGIAAVAEAIVPMLTLALPFLLLLVAAGVSLGYYYNRKSLAHTTVASE